MTPAAEILIKAGVLLNDEDAVRWSLQELADWLNAGQKAIVLAKPSALSGSVVLELSEGTLQGLPPLTEETRYIALLRLLRNITDIGPPRVGGRAVRDTTRDILDSAEPNWHDGSRVPFKPAVRQYVFDEANPREFYVYPGNDGTGLIEAVVSILPAKIVAAVETGPVDPTNIAHWATPIDLDPLYDDVLLDYILFRAYSRDDLAGNPGRAQAYYMSFANAVGLKIRTEAQTGPNARAGVTQS